VSFGTVIEDLAIIAVTESPEAAVNTVYYLPL
jgi:hypothetical protein